MGLASEIIERGDGGGAGTAGGAGPKLTQLMPADPSRGWSTPFYPLYTNSGDLNGGVYAAPGQTVRLVDPRSGQVYATGVGPEGAQQIATLANQLSQDLGRKAVWAVDTQNADNTYTTRGYDRYDPKSPGLLGTIARIAGPLLGAAIPGLWPVLGAALGGAGATLATGGNFKDALLAGATSGIGNFAGGALSSVLRGAPVVMSGVNPLAGVGSALSGLGGAGAAVPGAASALGGAGLSSVIDGVTTLPLTVAGNAAPGLLTTALSGAGTAVGGLVGAGAGAGQPTTSTDTGGTQPTTELEPLTVVGGANEGIVPPFTGFYDVPGLTSTEYNPLNNSAFSNQMQGVTVKDGNLFGLDPLDLLGNTLGGLGADILTPLLAERLGLLGGGGSGDLGGLPDGGFEQTPDVGPKGPPMVDTFLPPSGSTSPVPPALDGGTPDVVAPPGVAGDSVAAASGGGAPGGAPSPFSAGPDYAAPASGGGGADSGLDVQGGFTPDIYPWRKARMAA